MRARPWPIAVLLTLVGTACTGSTQVPEGDLRVRVDVVAAAPAPATRSRHLPAVLEGARDALLSARVGGVVVERTAAVGDVVQDGALLLRLDDREADAQARAAAAAVHDAEAVLGEARRRAERVTSLGDGASKADLDAVDTALARAEAAVDAARARRDLARTQRDHHRIVAPFTGEVALLDPEVGELVAPGTPVARVVDTSTLAVSLGVAADEIDAIAAGGARFQVQAGDVLTAATLAHAASSADPRSLTWPVELTLPAGPGLRPGGAVTVILALPTAAQAAIPVESLQVDGSIWTVQDGLAHRTPVQVAVEDGREALVQGVQPGALVVVRGGHRLHEGEAVVVVEGAP